LATLVTWVQNVQRAISRNFKRGRCESRAIFFPFIVSNLTFDTGASLASGPFQMLFGSTMRITTRPAHVTLPGLMGNRILLLSAMFESRLSAARENLAAKREKV